jgi:hypothetical protein
MPSRAGGGGEVSGRRLFTGRDSKSALGNATTRVTCLAKSERIYTSMYLNLANVIEQSILSQFFFG